MTRSIVKDRKQGRRVPLLRTPLASENFQPGDDPGLAHYEVVTNYLEQLGTARALAVWMMYVHGEHSEILKLTVDFEGVAWFRGRDALRRDYAATKLFSCADYLHLPEVDRIAVAIGKSRDAELQNSDTNNYLRGLRTGGIADPEFNSVLYTAARLVQKVLGTLDRALTGMVDGGWTSGRTTAVKSDAKSSPEKYQANLDVTPRAYQYASRLVGSSGLWVRAALGIACEGPCSLLPSAFNFVDHNVMMTVPKNAKTDRVICYEPHVNIRLQRSVGVYMRKCLYRKAGIDLQDQSFNQRRAYDGSVTGYYATIDLSAASDTLTTELVQALLPYDWFEFLNDLRCHRTLWPDGRITRNEKFASMGNGFTFELETLLFWALSMASSTTNDVTVYGDDIVVPTFDAPAVLAALNKAGFRANVDKTFLTGSFRESCGKDYYRGTDVTPVYLDYHINNVERGIRAHNAVRAFVRRERLPDLSWSRVLRRLRRTVDPTRTVPLGPEGRGDGHFHVNRDEACPSRPSPSGEWAGWDGWIYTTYLKMFPDRLVTCRSSDGMLLYQRLSSSDQVSPDALLCAAVGPKRAYSVYDLLKSNEWLECRRSRSFSNEWPDIPWVS